MNFYRRVGKRALDLSLTLPAAPIWLSLWAILVILVRIRLGAPAHFCQLRPGWKAIPFEMRKLRTMTQATGQDGRLLPDAQRMTRVGALLRKTSLDEFPTLWHVVKGEMSLVGPRPLLMEYLPRYSSEQARRHEVRPGVTGWAQVNGRNALSWEEKFTLDVWYVDHVGFLLDLKILWRTLAKVFFREGISAEGEVTMPVFMGSRRGNDG